MSQNLTLPIKVISVIVLLLFYQMLFAQPESDTKNLDKKQYQIKNYNLFDNPIYFQSGYSGEQLYFNSQFPSLENHNSAFLFQKKSSPANFSISQNKFVSTMPGLGSITHYTNQLRLKTGEKTYFEFGAGLAMQNTIIDPFIPNYQFSFRVAMEYNFNKRLSAYFYVQYITDPINKPDVYSDPLIQNNPFFIQSEIGAGVKAGLKNTSFDFKINSIYDTKFGGMTPVNSKIRIEF